MRHRRDLRNTTFTGEGLKDAPSNVGFLGTPRATTPLAALGIASLIVMVFIALLK